MLARVLILVGRHGQLDLVVTWLHLLAFQFLDEFLMQDSLPRLFDRSLRIRSFKSIFSKAFKMFSARLNRDGSDGRSVLPTAILGVRW